MQLQLMDPDASYYTKDVTVVLIREFQTSDKEMKKIAVLKVVNHRRCHTSVYQARRPA
jgi:hypothetical protein